MIPSPLALILCALSGIAILAAFVLCFRAWLRHSGNEGDEEKGSETDCEREVQREVDGVGMSRVEG